MLKSKKVEKIMQEIFTIKIQDLTILSHKVI